MRVHIQLLLPFNRALRLAPLCVQLNNPRNYLLERRRLLSGSARPSTTPAWNAGPSRPGGVGGAFCMRSCIRSQTTSPYPIFTIILYWNQFAFQDHLVLETSRLSTQSENVLFCKVENALLADRGTPCHSPLAASCCIAAGPSRLPFGALTCGLDGTMPRCESAPCDEGNGKTVQPFLCN
jgi:hypothetical protein